MKPEDFKAWRLAQGMTQSEAADALGIKRPSVALYERGTRYEGDRPVAIPKAIALACAAIAAGLAPIGASKNEGLMEDVLSTAYEDYRVRPASGDPDGFTPETSALRHAFFAGAKAALKAASNLITSAA